MQIDKAIKLFFRRARIDFQILKHPSDNQTKFDLFQRLNRGGAYANAQEVRTCSMVLVNPAFTKEIRRLASQENTIKIFRLKDKKIEKQEDIEYIVRMIVHTFQDYDRKLDVEEFIDKSIIGIIINKDHQKIMKTIEWILTLLFDIGEIFYLHDGHAVFSRYAGASATSGPRCCGGLD